MDSQEEQEKTVQVLIDARIVDGVLEGKYAESVIEYAEPQDWTDLRPEVGEP